MRAPLGHPFAFPGQRTVCAAHAPEGARAHTQCATPVARMRAHASVDFLVRGASRHIALSACAHSFKHSCQLSFLKTTFVLQTQPRTQVYLKSTTKINIPDMPGANAAPSQPYIAPKEEKVKRVTGARQLCVWLGAKAAGPCTAAVRLAAGAASRGLRRGLLRCLDGARSCTCPRLQARTSTRARSGRTTT